MFIERFFSVKVRKVMLWLVGAWLFFGSVILIGIPAWKADQAFNELSYGARVDSIKFVSGHRGHPYILMNNKWRLLTIDEMKVVPILQIGDSLVKTSGSATINIYRKSGPKYELIKTLD